MPATKVCRRNVKPGERRGQSPGQALRAEGRKAYQAAARLSDAVPRAKDLPDAFPSRLNQTLTRRCLNLAPSFSHPLHLGLASPTSQWEATLRSVISRVRLQLSHATIDKTLLEIARMRAAVALLCG